MNASEMVMNMMKETISRALKSQFWRKLLKNVSIVLAGNGGSTVINLLLTIIMIRALGNTDYGISFNI